MKGLKKFGLTLATTGLAAGMLLQSASVLAATVNPNDYVDLAGKHWGHLDNLNDADFAKVLAEIAGRIQALKAEYATINAQIPEAKQAKSSADLVLANAEKALKNATEAFNAAKAAKEDTEKKIKKAVTDFEVAEQKYEEAKQGIENAKVAADTKAKEVRDAAVAKLVQPSRTDLTNAENELANAKSVLAGMEDGDAKNAQAEQVKVLEAKVAELAGAYNTALGAYNKGVAAAENEYKAQLQANDVKRTEELRAVEKKFVDSNTYGANADLQAIVNYIKDAQAKLETQTKEFDKAEAALKAAQKDVKEADVKKKLADVKLADLQYKLRDNLLDQKNLGVHLKRLTLNDKVDVNTSVSQLDPELAAIVEEISGKKQDELEKEAADAKKDAEDAKAELDELKKEDDKKPADADKKPVEADKKPVVGKKPVADKKAPAKKLPQTGAVMSIAPAALGVALATVGGAFAFRKKD